VFKRQLSRASFIAPAVAVLFAVTIYPFVYALINSFRRWILYKPHLGRPFVGIGNYQDLLTSPAFWNSFNLTVIYVVITVLGTLLIGIAIALLVDGERIRGKNAFRSLLILPFFVPPVVTGFVFRFMFDTSVGVYGYFLSKLGIHLKTILGSPSLALYAVCLADIWLFTPLVFLIILAALQTVPTDIIEAAKIDGASPWRCFLHITLPFLQPAILVTLLIRTIDAFRAFDVIYMMTQGGPGSSTETFNLLGYKTGFDFWRMGSASAFSIFILAMLIAISTVFIRYLGRQSDIT